MKGYCMKCQRETELAATRPVVMRNGRWGTEGKCPECGTRLFRLGRETPAVKEETNAHNDRR